MAKAIPDRWTAYKACGSVIEGTSFICFKVPLRKVVQQNVKEIDEIWSIETMVAKIPRLGAVIDLTNTARYYDPKVLEATGVRHKKILIPGREIPSEGKVKEFTKAVDDFLKLDPGMIIGVHCTHGLNRTGYMVCRYMRDRMSIPAEIAIEKFEAARKYHIERKNYLADLKGEKPPPPDKGPHTEVKPFEPFDLESTEDGRIVRSDFQEANKRSRRGNGKVEELSWRKRSYDSEVARDFNNFGNHRPRYTTGASDTSKSDSKRSRNSSKYAFDYRFDY